LPTRAIRPRIPGVMERTPAIQKHVVRVALGRQPSDFAYWQSQPYLARLAALEQIRQEYHRWRYGAQPGFQRVCRVAKR